MIDLKPIYQTMNPQFMLWFGIVLLIAGIIIFAMFVTGINEEVKRSYPKNKHVKWHEIIKSWGIHGFVFLTGLTVLLITTGILFIVPNSPVRQAAAKPTPPPTQTIVRYVESKTDVTHLSCDDKTDTNDIIECTFVLNNTPRDGKLVIDNDHATLFYNDNASFVPVTAKTTN